MILRSASTPVWDFSKARTSTPDGARNFSSSATAPPFWIVPSTVSPIRPCRISDRNIRRKRAKNVLAKTFRRCPECRRFRCSGSSTPILIRWTNRRFLTPTASRNTPAPPHCSNKSRPVRPRKKSRKPGRSIWRNSGSCGRSICYIKINSQPLSPPTFTH